MSKYYLVTSKKIANRIDKWFDDANKGAKAKGAIIFEDFGKKNVKGFRVYDDGDVEFWLVDEMPKDKRLKKGRSKETGWFEYNRTAGLGMREQIAEIAYPTRSDLYKLIGYGCFLVGTTYTTPGISPTKDGSYVVTTHDKVKYKPPRGICRISDLQAENLLEGKD